MQRPSIQSAPAIPARPETRPARPAPRTRQATHRLHYRADKGRPAGCETSPAPPRRTGPAKRPRPRLQRCAAAGCPTRFARPPGRGPYRSRPANPCCQCTHRAPKKPRQGLPDPAREPAERGAQAASWRGRVQALQALGHPHRAGRHARPWAHQGVRVLLVKNTDALCAYGG